MILSEACSGGFDTSVSQSFRPGFLMLRRAVWHAMIHANYHGSVIHLNSEIVR